MELTVHLLTKNNARTITKAIQSLTPLQAEIVVADLGSADGTPLLAQRLGAKVVRYEDVDRSAIRNRLVAESRTDFQMYLEPWEALTQGHDQIRTFTGQTRTNTGHVLVFSGTVLSKETRIWRKQSGHLFANPVCESLQSPFGSQTGAVFYSDGGPDPVDRLKRIEEWKALAPTAKEPYYYQAMNLLAAGNLDEFLRVVKHYLFIETKPCMSAIMARYYFALVSLIKEGKAKPVSQNLNICLSNRPLMAEFWCLQGDVYFHLLNRKKEAVRFYENALALGSKRRIDDPYPMDLAKYDDYPTSMIGRCQSVG
jgi:hypothetical protein